MIKTTSISSQSKLSWLSMDINSEVERLVRNNCRIISIQYSAVYNGRDDYGQSQHSYEAIIVYEDHK